MNLRTTRFRRDIGFTLIELLVVVAIIAILAAILFPVFAEARNRARLTTCISNMKQIMIAMSAYIEDNDGKFPICVDHAGAWDNHSIGGKMGQLWGTQGCIVPPEQRPLNQYVKNLKIWQCPREKIQKPPLGPGNISDYDLEGTSYIANGVWYWNNGWGPSLYGRTISQVKYPAAQIVIGERGIQNFYNNRADQGYRNHDPNEPKVVVGFADGHAAYVTMAYGLWEGWVSGGRPNTNTKWIICMPEWHPSWGT